MEAQRPDWRKSYMEMIDVHVESMKTWRAEGRDACLELPNGKRVRCTDLTDDQIYELSRRFAEIDVNRAIYEFNYKA